MFNDNLVIYCTLARNTLFFLENSYCTVGLYERDGRNGEHLVTSRRPDNGTRRKRKIYSPNGADPGRVSSVTNFKSPVVGIASVSSRRNAG